MTPGLMPSLIASQPPSTETRMKSFGSLPAAFSAVAPPKPGGLVDRVDDVDARVLLQQRLHRRLALGLIALGGRGADDLRVALLDAEALQEAVVAELADGDARREVEHARSSA